MLQEGIIFFPLRYFFLSLFFHQLILGSHSIRMNATPLVVVIGSFLTGIFSSTASTCVAEN